MAGSVNQVTLLGALGKDPEIRTTQDGRKIANFSMATSESWIAKGSGEKKERVEWHRVVVFNEHTAGVAERFLKKGSKVYVQGSLHTRKWTDQQGVERYSTEIEIGAYGGSLVLIGDAQQQRSDGGQRQESAPQQQRASGGQTGKQYGGQGSDLDDEIPF